MIGERAFARRLRIERNLIACDEVTTYGCIADVLAIDPNKKLIVEYEFKRNSNDLKIAEKKKSKYGIRKTKFRGQWKLRTTRGKYGYRTSGYNIRKESQRPHQFFFVVSKELYEKEKEYLHSLDTFTGVMAPMCPGGKYYVMKRSAIRKNNLQKYDCVLRDICKRLANVYTWGIK